MEKAAIRRMPVGAEIVAGSGVHFRVWAPAAELIEVLIEPEPSRSGREQACAVPLTRESSGYHSGTVPGSGSGTGYRYRIKDRGTFPDPASRFQPEGPHGRSQVVDPDLFQWNDAEWKGIALRGSVLYEMHVGTFTMEGTWAAAAARLPALAEAGITLIEVMPVADFPGRFGWGYDGVCLFAPTRLYGAPDDFRSFVDKAHGTGIGVILDVVYNHLGPEGNYLGQFSPGYFTDRYENEWGDALNFDGPDSGPVREFFAANAAYWVREYHLDGLRFDATQQMFDSSSEHILAAIAKEVRRVASRRSVILVAENESQDVQLLRGTEPRGLGMDALWNDDFHHSATVALTGRSEAYYSDYRGRPQEFVSLAKRGYLYQGQYYTWQKKPRGTPTTGIEPASFVNYLQNHDQTANSARGERMHLLSSPGLYRAMTALFLLAPGTPMLFQGQEFGASSPFLFFTDLKEDLAVKVRLGRSDFLSQFPSLADPETQSLLSDPCDPLTFTRSKLDWSERARHVAVYSLHVDLIRLRREDPVFRLQASAGIDGAVLSADAFVLRYFGENGQDRLLLINLGVDLTLAPAPEPLLAPPSGMRWETLWSSEHPTYGGDGAPMNLEQVWKIPGHAAVVLRSIEEMADV